MSTVVFETVPVGADSDTTMASSISGFGVIDLSPGETETITFDMTTNTGDAPTFIVGMPPPAAGNLVVDDADIGTFTYTITQAQWVAAGSPGTVELVFDTTLGSFNDNYQLTITCFAPGTLITTPNGEKVVETLAIGDLIRAADGRDVAVKWVGVQTVSTIFSGNVERLQPVRISAGALGTGLPHSDLTVTADHGMVIDGLVINAAALVNGSTIRVLPMAEMGETFTVYHIETEDHDVILANGAPTETYTDAVSRAVFDNFQDYLDLYGAEAPVVELNMPRVASQRLVPSSIKARLGLAGAWRSAS